MYSQINEIIVTTDNSFSIFIYILNRYNSDLQLTFMKLAIKTLSDKEYVDSQLASMIKSQVEFDGNWVRYSEEIDGLDIDYEDFDREELLTNKWISRKGYEISLILDYIKEKTGVKDANEEDNNSHRLKVASNLPKKEVVEILYKNLNPDFIQADFPDFEALFDNDVVSRKIKWHGLEAEIKFLFDWLTDRKIIDSDTQCELIARNFVNRKGNDFDAKQLTTVKSKPRYQLISDASKKYPLHKSTDFKSTMINIKKDFGKY